MLYGAQISLIFGHMKDLYILPVLWIYIPENHFLVLSETLEASHVVKCIEKAKQSRHIENPLIFIVTEDVNMYQKHFTRQRKE